MLFCDFRSNALSSVAHPGTPPPPIAYSLSSHPDLEKPNRPKTKINQPLGRAGRRVHCSASVLTSHGGDIKTIGFLQLHLAPK